MTAKGIFWALCLIAGMLGGVISHNLFPPGEVMAQKSPSQKRVVAAEDFHLVDKTGKLRGALFVSSKGEPGFALFDPEGKSRILLMLHADGSAVFDLKDKKEQTQATFGLSTEGDPEIKLIGTPKIILLDKEKKVLWDAP